jgi:Protein of unknown function (DUF3168)
MSTQTSTGEIQAAVYAKFVPSGTLDTGLAALSVTGVFDFGAVLVNQPLPYITIGEFQEGPLNAFGRRGYLTRHLMHIWDNDLGFKRSQSIMARMNFLIDQKPLTLASQALVYLLYQMSHNMNDPGVDNIRHTVVEYESFSQE